MNRLVLVLFVNHERDCVIFNPKRFQLIVAISLFIMCITITLLVRNWEHVTDFCAVPVTDSGALKTNPVPAVVVLISLKASFVHPFTTYGQGMATAH